MVKRYVPLREFSIDGVLDQATQCLDIAAQLAANEGDTKELRAISAEFMEIASRVHGVPEEEYEEPERHPIGFEAANAKLEVVANDTDED